MNNLENSLVHGKRQKICHGLATQISVLALGAAFLMAPMVTRAGSGPITQLQYLQWVAQLSGAGSQFKQGSSSSDYINWAKSIGMNPSGGWQADKSLSKDVLSSTLVQAFNINPNRYGGDSARALQRNGIDLSGVSDKVTRDQLTEIVDQFGVISRFGLLVSSNNDKNSSNHPAVTPKGHHDQEDEGDKDEHDNKPKPPKVVLCHKGHTIRVSAKAVAKHLAHGDTLGPCTVTRHGHDRDDDDHDEGDHGGHDNDEH